MKKNYFALFFIVVSLFLYIFTFNTYSQVTQQWVRNYNTVGIDIGKKTRVDKFTGNIYVSGTVDGSFVTIKYSPSGQQLWVKKYSIPSQICSATDMVLDNLGGIIITGNSSYANNSDIITIKYSSDGSVQWIKKYNGVNNSYDYALAMATDGQGGIIVTGKTYSNSTEDDVLTIKYSHDGTQEWLKKFNSGGNSIDNAKSVTIDGEKNVYLTGRSEEGDIFKWFTLKYTAAGNLVWVKYDSSDRSVGYKIVNSESMSQVYSIGFFYPGGTSEGNLKVTAFNRNGDKQWENYYSNWDYISNAVFDENFKLLYLFGVAEESGIRQFITVASNVSRQGGTSWFDLYSNEQFSTMSSSEIVLDNNHNIYVTGTSSNSTTQSDFVTLKYDIGGNRIWKQSYNQTGTGINRSKGITVDNSGNVYVMGLSDNGNSTDITTIKYSQGILPRDPLTNIPGDFMLYQNYPNPFNPSTQIKYELPLDANVKITVYDMLGKELAVLVNEQKTAGRYNVSFDASRISSGMYFYKIEAGSYTDTKKMLLVK